MRDFKPVGERRTTQRDAIIMVIRATAGPLTIHDILAQARREQPALGRATVYRTIRLLLESGLIKVVTLPDGLTRYECADLAHHCHFRCRLCKKVYALCMCAVTIPDGATLPGGYRVERHQLTLHGVCPKCSRRPKKR